MKVFSGQKNPDISTGRDVPHFTGGGNGHFSIGKLSVFGSDGGSRWDWFCGGKKVGELCGSLAK